MKRRENTFRINYANVPKMPSSEVVHRFVGEKLGLKREEVLRIQYSRNLSVAFVKVISLELAQEVVENNDNKHEVIVDGKPYKLRLVMEDGAVDVKLYNLSEDVTNDKIMKFLSGYGETFSIREELWDEKHFFPGLPNGVRIVRMIAKKNIPSYVSIDGETTLVSYFGQQHICRYCNESAHNGISCVQNKKLLVQKLATNNTSYAEATKNSLSTHANSSTARPGGSKSLVSKPNVPKQQTQNQVSATTEPHTSGTMPPPASVVVLRATGINDCQSPSNVQQSENDDSWTRVTRRSGKKTDGNETDSSTSSKSSHKQRAGKKMRVDDAKDSQNTDPLA